MRFSIVDCPRFVICAVLALAACQQGDAPQNDAQPAPAAEAAGAAAQAPPAASLWNNGQAKPLDAQASHANGVVLQLVSLQSRPSDTGVGVRIINGHSLDIDLNRFSGNRHGFLLLETGERLYLSPPDGNPRLTVPAGQTFEGELVFAGRLAPVRSAVLVLNDKGGDSGNTAMPAFRIDLPLSGGADVAQ